MPTPSGEVAAAPAIEGADPGTDDKQTRPL